MSQPRIGARFGRYRIDSQLGMGGMGVVFRATDLRLHRQVALKIISSRLAADDEFLVRFHREAETLTRLDSPHVIKVLEHGEYDGVPFIASPLIAGGDLDQLLKQRGPLPPQVAAAVTAQIAEALAATHAVGVVHRDVKPANVLVHDPAAPVPHIYLCDFGIAQTDSPGLTATGARIGTWTYLAPERHQGGPASVATDIYALGCVFWKLLTGRAPYAGSDVEIALAHVEAPVPRLPGRDPLTSRLNDIVGRALAKNSRDRYPDATAVRADLVAASAPLGGSGADVTIPAGQPVGGARRGRGRIVAAVVVSLLVALGVAAGARFVLSDDDDGSPAAESSSTPRPSPETPDHIEGDLDGDGHGDLATVTDTENGARISAYSLASSTPGKPRHLPIPADTVLRGDLDGDRTPELVYVEGLGSEVTIGVFGRDGTFELLTSRLPPNTDGVLATFALGDFDADGDDDVLAEFEHPSRPGTTQFSVAEIGNNGVAAFRPWFRLNGWGPLEVRAVPGDFDGTGPDDLALALEKSPDYPGEPSALMHLRSDGRAFTAAAGRTPVLQSSGRKVRASQGDYIAADFDGDDDDELAYVDGFHDPEFEITTLEVMVHDFDARFGAGRDWRAGLEPRTVTEGLSTTSIHFAPSDVDGDGRADLVGVAAAANGRLKVLALRSTGRQLELAGRWPVEGCQDELACRRTYAVRTDAPKPG